MIRRLAFVIAAIALAGVVYSGIPPATEVLDTSPSGVRGAIHVHTRRSDGTGSIDDVAAAAARAGLAFVVITDHGDAARAPERPAYRQGVLCIDAVEISTTGGHLVALGLGRAPYPLGGEPRDVVEDVRRLGGLAIAAHPGSPKPELRWTSWDLPIDGLEWLNGDSEWRDENISVLTRALLTYPIRRSETLASLLDRPVDVLRRWDQLNAHRRVVALAAADAHARIGLRGAGDPYDSAITLHVPSYEQVFKTFSIALPQATLTGEAAADASTVVEEIRRGHVYSAIDGLARPARFEFSASTAAATAVGGDRLDGGGDVSIRIASQAPPGSTIALLRDGEPVMTGAGHELAYRTSGAPAVYRAEVHLSHAPGDPPVPWIVSNPIYVGLQETAAPPADPSASAYTATVYDDGGAAGWAIEKSAGALGALDVVSAVPTGQQLRLRYALGGTASESPYVALVFPPGAASAGAGRITFTAHADRPMRISVQARVPDAGGGQRWRRSIYVDEQTRPVSVRFADMTPPAAGTAPRFDIATVQSFLFVVDTLNTPIGSNGQVWIDDVRFGR